MSLWFNTSLYKQADDVCIYIYVYIYLSIYLFIYLLLYWKIFGDVEQCMIIKVNDVCIETEYISMKLLLYGAQISLVIYMSEIYREVACQEYNFSQRLET